MRIGPLLLSVLFVPSLVRAQAAQLEQGAGEPRIVVSVSRSVRVPASHAAVYAVIEATAETSPEAVQRAMRKLQAVTDSLRAAGVPAQDIAVVPYGLAPAVSIAALQMATPPQAPYTARFVVRLAPTRVERVTAVAAAAVSGGAGSAVPAAFETAAADSVRRVLYADALAQARRDAEALATALGGGLGPLIEATSTVSPNQGFQGASFSFPTTFSGYAGPSQPPEVTITASASVRFRFVPR